MNAKINIVTKSSITSSIKYDNTDLSTLKLAFAYFSVTTTKYYWWLIDAFSGKLLIRIGFMLLTNCVDVEGGGGLRDLSN